MGPNYACLFVGYVEQSLFHCYTGTIPQLFLCYIDDCISAASCSHEELEQFINFTNTSHPNLKFTWTISDIALPFLDLSVTISEINISLDQSEGSILSDDYLDTPDDLDINVDDLETPDETDSLEYLGNGNELEWE
eukprot:g45686.t1